MTRKNKSQRIKPIRDLALSREHTAARLLGNSRKAMLDCQKRLRELAAFREEYAQQLRQAGEGGINGSTLQTFQHYINQLDAAISQQRQQLAQAEDNCLNHTRHWQEMHRRTRILDKTIHRMQLNEKRIVLRREQREQDDLIQNRHSHPSRRHKKD